MDRWSSCSLTDSAVASASGMVLRDPLRHELYLHAALREIPRLLGSIDRNPLRATYGCFDRQYWHYRTAAFPSEMYQEGVLPLALIYSLPHRANRWHGDEQVRALAIAGLQFSARSMHADGSCDDYYPYERALGAAAFSLQAAAEAYRVLQLDDRALLDALVLRARWLAEHHETGTLANHHALAALALRRVGLLANRADLLHSAEQRLGQLLALQSDEGWFTEYGGADPGYTTVTIDCLAKYLTTLSPLASGESPGVAASLALRIRESLRRAVEFAHHFILPDGSFGGVIGSRGTTHCYPHGFELLAPQDPRAADLAEGCLQGLANDTRGFINDDRLYVHALGNWLEAYRDAVVERPASATPTTSEPRWFDHAQVLVDRRPQRHTIVSAARGGSFMHFVNDLRIAVDAGWVLETADGRCAVSQLHSLDRSIDRRDPNAWAMNVSERLTVAGPLHWIRWETATPLKQAVFHMGMQLVGRWCRDLVRRVLQRRLITQRQSCGLELQRTIELLEGSTTLRVTDRLIRTDARLKLRRLALSSDLEAPYVAAANVYQAAAWQSWTDMSPHVDELNKRGELTVVRSW